MLQNGGGGVRPDHVCGAAQTAASPASVVSCCAARTDTPQQITSPAVRVDLRHLDESQRHWERFTHGSV